MLDHFLIGVYTLYMWFMAIISHIFRLYIERVGIYIFVAIGVGISGISGVVAGVARAFWLPPSVDFNKP